MYDSKFKSELERLNKEQKEAVDTIEGPVIVIAGPGTGKTQILALRIGNILKKTQVNPENILALTFTDSGAIAMRERLLSLIGSAAMDVQIYTFHSFCSKIMEEFPEYFSFRNELTFLDEIDQILLLQRILDELEDSPLTDVKNPYGKVKNLISAISNAKQELLKYDDVVKYCENKQSLIDQDPSLGKTKKNAYLKDIEKASSFLEVWEKYEEIKEKEGLFDFNDLLIQVLKVFRGVPDVLLQYQELCQYVLVDEFQDTNGVQADLVHLLMSYYKESPNLFVVGDDDQSIYRFQGASVENFKSFMDKYPTALKVVLKENYRSTQTILDASRSVIQNNVDRLDPDKTLHAQGKYEEKPLTRLTFSTDVEEFSFVANKIQELINNGVSPSEIAIICTQNRHLLEISDYISNLNIHYFLSADANVFDNQYVKYVLALIRVLDDFEDLYSLVQFLFLPSLNISADHLLECSKWLRYSKVNDVLDLKEEDFSKWPEIYKWIIYIKELTVRTKQEPYYRVLNEAVEKFEIIKYLAIQTKKIDDFEAIALFLRYMKYFEQSKNETELSDFLAHVNAIFEHNKGPKLSDKLASLDSIKLLTAHKSKGLEYEYVFIPQTTNKAWAANIRQIGWSLPKDLITQNFSNETDAEEEKRRLFYVALTRAKKEIFLTRSKTYGMDPKETLPSKFETEIEDRFIQTVTPEPLSFTELTKLVHLKQTDTFERFKESQHLHNIIQNFELTPSAFNTYLRCKKQFFVEYILRAPTPSNYSMMKGIFVHHLIEMHITDGHTSREALLKTAHKWIDSNKILLEEEKKLLLKEAFEEVFGWLEFHREQNKMFKPYKMEYGLENRKIYFEQIPIKGRIDLIEILDPVAKTIRVVDFKTSSNRTTAKTLVRNDNGIFDDKYHQLMFYKLLLDSYAEFKFKTIEGVISYTTPTDGGNYSNTDVTFNDIDMDVFKDKLKEVYVGIQELKFLEFEKECECFNGCKYDYLE